MYLCAYLFIVAVLEAAMAFLFDIPILHIIRQVGELRKKSLVSPRVFIPLNLHDQRI